MEKDKEEIAKWRKAGKLGAEVLSYAKKIIKPEMPLLEIAEKVEKKIQELGVKNAFPINLSINEIAAHSSPLYNDTSKAQGLLKVDLGVSIEGYLSDLACSLDLTPEQKYKDLILASEYALKEAIKVIRPGISLFEVGKIIQDTIAAFNLAPVRNLSGHEIKPWRLHSGLTIPNYDNGNTTKLTEGMIIAIEPMLVSGNDNKGNVSKDGWTVFVRDGITSHSEHTIAITKTGNIVLTRRENE